MKLQVVTCASHAPTEPYYFQKAFFASLTRYGMSPVILGAGTKWGGLGSKPKLLQRAINWGLVSADYIIFCDSFDLVFADDPYNVLDTFLGMVDGTPCDLMWGAEKSCFPDAHLAALHPPTSSPFKYLNSGFGIGTLEAFTNALVVMRPEETLKDDFRDPDGVWHHDNDQDAWMRAFLNDGLIMGLDHHCRLVQNFCSVTEEEMDFSGERIRNLVTDSCPLVMHCNGPKEFWRDKILDKLNLPKE